MAVRTRYRSFTACCGMCGLARDNGSGMIEVLAVVATRKRAGQLRQFIADLKGHYQTICVWHISNPLIEECLARYGFKPEATVDEFGGRLHGLRWDAPAAVSKTPGP